MVSVKNKKRGSNKGTLPKVKGLSRLDLLRKKLEVEQELLEAGKPLEGEKIEEIEEQLEQNSKDYDEESEDDDQEDALAANRIEKVADLINAIPKKSVSEESKDAKETIRKLTKKIEKYRKLFDSVRKEVAKVVVGQHDAVTGMFRALIADGHVLVEGVPGIAKTTLIRTLAETTACSFSRIQFTPDLLPTDIVGISTYQEGRGFYTLKGPIFNNFILADEINRAPPKVQSALLECMAEKQATIAKESFPVPLPFFTMATQNPVENVGTYTLPEAQIDRFLFKIYMGYPNIDEEQDILRTNISVRAFDSFEINPVLNPELITQIQEDAKKIYVDKKVERYIVRMIDATRFPKKYKINLGKYLEYGASPRGSIGLFKAARADALLNGQSYVTPHNVKTVTYDVLRHRIILSYEGQAEGIKSEEVVSEILKKVPVP